MGRLKDNLDEMHLYINKSEMLIKDTIWAISWIGGICAINKTTDKQALASAYLVFSLSLIMEFGRKIKDKKHWFSRVVDGVFCLAIICILLMATAALMGVQLCGNDDKVMFNISIGIMIDFFVVWIEPDIKIPDNKEENKDMEIDDKVDLFEKNLYSGCLGDINKGDDKDE